MKLRDAFGRVRAWCRRAFSEPVPRGMPYPMLHPTLPALPCSDPPLTITHPRQNGAERKDDLMAYKHDTLDDCLDAIKNDTRTKVGRAGATALTMALDGDDFAAIGAALFPNVKPAQQDGRGRAAVALALKRVELAMRARG